MTKFVSAIFFIILIATNSFCVTITLKNNTKVKGTERLVKRETLYIENSDVLFVVHNNVIRETNSKQIDSLLENKKRCLFDGIINYNAYKQFIYVNRRTINDKEIQELILSYNPNININQIIAPAIPEKNSKMIDTKYIIATKPVRLIVNWYDLTLGYRFINRSSEIRTSITYCPALPFIYQESGVYIWSDVKVITWAGTYRKYLKNCRGFYAGCGLSGILLKIYNIDTQTLVINPFDPYSLGFEGNELKNITCYLGGPLIELGYTGYLFKCIYSNFNIGIMPSIGQIKGSDIDNTTLIGILPSIGYSVGYTF